MPGPDEEFTVSEPLGERLGRLAARMLKHLRQATCPALPSAPGSPRAYSRPAGAAIDSVADIDILEAAPLNAGRCVVIGENLSVITDPKSGGNSAKETDESIAEEGFHRAAVHFVEINFGTTVTAAEIQAAVGEACSPGDE
jgi:hypothetical protein